MFDRVMLLEVIGDTGHIKIVSCMWSTEKSILGLFREMVAMVSTALCYLC